VPYGGVRVVAPRVVSRVRPVDGWALLVYASRPSESGTRGGRVTEIGTPIGGETGGDRDPATRALLDEWRTAAYNCFSSGHKFCREVCPVMQVTADEAYSPTAFHANVVAIDRGELALADVAGDYVNCTMCGACELRCPNTLFTGDFYRFRQRTVDVVKAMRTLAIEHEIHQPGWKRWNELTDRWGNEPVLGNIECSQSKVRAWAAGLGIPTGGETLLFCDCEAAFHRTSLPRAVAQLLQAGGVDFGLMRQQWCCGGPAYEMGYAEIGQSMAEHNVADWRACGAKRILCLDPHDYLTFVDVYPQLFGDAFDFEIVLVVDVVAELLRDGKITLSIPINRTVTYHDACRLNKRMGVHQAPREILRRIPGIVFKDVDHVTQWSYCSGAGGGLPIERPDLTAAISRSRIDRAAELEVDTLVSACPWSERPLTEQGHDRGIEVYDLMELVAESAGFEV
jgi:heterodisulfide reductase subunit D